MVDLEQVIMKIHTLAFELDKLEIYLNTDSLKCPYSLKHSILCVYKDFLEKYNSISIKTLLDLFRATELDFTYLNELNRVAIKTQSILNMDDKQLDMYNPLIHGLDILHRELEYQFQSKIEATSNAIKELKSCNSQDPCTSEYEYIRLINQYKEEYEYENQWLLSFNPYKKFHVLIEAILSLEKDYDSSIDKDVIRVEDTDPISYSIIESIYEHSKGVLFEEEDINCYYNCFNPKEDTKTSGLEVKAKGKASSLIYLLKKKLKLTDKWEQDVLDNLPTIKDHYMKNRNKYLKEILNEIGKNNHKSSIEKLIPQLIEAKA